jgi:hypothetical protein
MKTLISLLLYLICASAWSQCSPIVIDTRRDGIELGPAGRGVSFDVNADGFPDLVQWVRPGGDEAFLTLDRNRNGIVDDGSELFGVGTPLLAGGTAPTGFVALAQYDQPLLGGNDDGLISRADAIWQELGMWVDSNADGIATLGEMRRPESFGLTSFATIPKVRRYTDPAGNSLPYWAWASAGRRARALMVDVFFLLLGPADQILTPAGRCPGSGPAVTGPARGIVGTATGQLHAAVRASSPSHAIASLRSSTERPVPSPTPSCRASSGRACRDGCRSAAAADADRPGSLAC